MVGQEVVGQAIHLCFVPIARFRKQVKINQIVFIAAKDRLSSIPSLGCRVGITLRNDPCDSCHALEDSPRGIFFQ